MAKDDRYARLTAIDGWDQRRLCQATLLVAGIGALGNEVVKNAALLGFGRLILIDRDRVERSNLCRSVLFRDRDVGQPKALVAAARAAELAPDAAIVPLVADLESGVGLGWMRRADIVIGALDNRAARLWLNRACTRAHRPWIDGGIEAFEGIVRAFFAPHYACYECTLSEADWAEVRRRQSCSAPPPDGTMPTTPLTASAIGALQVQQAVRWLHGDKSGLGRGLHLDTRRLHATPTVYPLAPSCRHHQFQPPIEVRPDLSSATPRRDIAAVAATLLDDEATLLLDPSAMDATPHALGLPAWSVIWARSRHREIGIELTGDAPPGWA